MGFREFLGIRLEGMVRHHLGTVCISLLTEPQEIAWARKYFIHAEAYSQEEFMVILWTASRGSDIPQVCVDSKTASMRAASSTLHISL